jgi:uncharacterized protein YkwD
MPRMNHVASLRIFRADPENPTEFVYLTAVGAHLNKFVDDSVYPKRTYSYFIRYNDGSHSTRLSPPSNIATATTPEGAPPANGAKYRQPNVAIGGTTGGANSPQGKPTTLAPYAPIPPNGIGTAIPLDNLEEEFLALLNTYRISQGAGPVRVSISLTRAAEVLAKENAENQKLSKIGSQGGVRQRARFYSYDVDTIYDSVVMLTRSYPDEMLNQLKQSPQDNEILLNPIWKVAGIARAYDNQGNWYWTIDFSAFWDYTIPLPGEDEDGRIDGNELVRTRPPKEALAEGHTFTGYGDDGKPYNALHCDNVTKSCWKDPAPPGNPSLDEFSDPDFLDGLWHVQYEITPTGIVHFNDPAGYDLTEFTMTLQFKKEGGKNGTNYGSWVSQGFRAYQRPTPSEAGTWSSVHDASRNEEIVTFYRDDNKPTVKIRIHATKEALTFFVLDGGDQTKNFFMPVPADGYKKDDQQVIFTKGMGFIMGPHEPFPADKRCVSCPQQ